MKRSSKRILSILLCLAMLLAVLPVGVLAQGTEMTLRAQPTLAMAEVGDGSFMNLSIRASQTSVQVGDVVDYTVYAFGSDIVAMQFDLVIPEGMSYVAGSASVPSGLKSYLGWEATDWTELTMRWTGYSDLPSEFENDTVILTFSCVAEAAGEHQISLDELWIYDGNFEEVTAVSTYIDGMYVFGEVVEPPVIVSYTDVYCQVPDTWDNCVVYWWGSSGYNPDWPGEDMMLDSNGVWEYEVPSDATGLVFNNGQGGQTADLVVPTDDNNMYVVATRQWQPYQGTPVAPEANYYVAGESGLCGVDWDPCYAANKMSDADGDGIYTIIYNNVYAGEYEFKVTRGFWDESWGQNGGMGNYVLNVPVNNMQVVINFNSKTGMIDTSCVMDASFMNVTVKASKNYASVGDVIDYTVYAYGDGITAMQFNLIIPEGMSYVADSASVPSGLKNYLGWVATDWTEASMIWTGYNDLPATFEDGTVVLTFSCEVESAGKHMVALDELCAHDEDFEEVPVSTNFDSVTVTKPAATVGVYLSANDWTHAYVYWWGYAAGYDLAWPGEHMIRMENGYWYYEVPADAEGLVFNDGNSLVQSPDLQVPIDNKNLYLFDRGCWRDPYYYEPEVDEYYVADSGKLCGVEWDPCNEANKMSDEDGDGIYTITYYGVGAGNYEFKVTNGSWDQSWGQPDSSSNYLVLVAKDNSNLTITFDSNTKLISVMATWNQPEGAFMNVAVVPSQPQVVVGQTVDYTVYAYGDGITALQFNLEIPEGLTYVAGSAAVPSGLKSYLGWAATDWTESIMMWTGYNDLPATFEEGTVLLTFSCVAEVTGDISVELYELLPFDEEYEEMEAFLRVDPVHVILCEHEFIATKDDATCTTDGYMIYTCWKCDYSYVGDAIPALGHSFVNYVSNGDATCMTDGTKTAKCDRCDETHTVIDEGSALGHSFSNYISNGDAICTVDGTKTSVCDRCDVTHTIVDEGSALGHSFSNYISNGDATCTVDGTKTSVCDRCDVTDTVVDVASALGHSFTSYISNDDYTCMTDGTKTAQCDRCDVTDVQVDEGTARHRYENDYCVFCDSLDPTAVILTGVLTTGTEGEAQLIFTVAGETVRVMNVQDGTYLMNQLVEGESVLTVSKEGYVTREYKLDLAAGLTELNLKLSVRGDVNGDGKLNMGEVARIYSHIRQTVKIADEYQLQCADASGDGKLNMGDVARLYATIKA